MISQEIRRNFLEFFKKQGHSIISSSSVVPHEDPTLLFINAGMNQFKDVFLGKSTRDYTKAATSQKCIRVGGKHNDLENVGHTTRHLTFFEMLGNFSFGDYFKKEAIEYAWKVSTEVFALPEEKIWITVFQDDDEAFELWKKFVPESRIVRMGEKDNFWAMGDTGPCGPCSELLFDRGNRYGNARSPSEDPAGERFFEFWNLVFMQFNRDIGGKLLSLPKQSIDTGAGLERVVSLKEGVNTVFETDIFRSLIAQIENVSGVAYNFNNPSAPAFHVIADHIRSLAFAIGDGAQPSNIERGYVLRKILRRAVRYGRNLGMQEPFLAKILPRLVEIMGPDYPELYSSLGRTSELLTLEEESFFRTLKRGGNILNQIIEKAEKSPLKQIEGEDAFKLKDTYGLPLEEILLIAKDTGVNVNLESYQILEEQAKEKSRAVEGKITQTAETSLFKDFTATHGKTVFKGYEKTSCESSVLAIIQNGAFVNSLKEGEEGSIILNETPFYPEKGGQIFDTGTVKNSHLVLDITSCQTPYADVIVHTGKVVTGSVQVGDSVTASIDVDRRQKIANNHTATHLLHAALQHVLGPHIRQAGSVVEPSRLRFDFNHHKAITPKELKEIEMWVNAKIRTNAKVSSYELSYEEAQKKQDIKQFFGEKYGATVRVIDAECSKELCGGTHTSTLGTIGFCLITKESSIAAGVRRIEALTGQEAELFLYDEQTILDNVCQLCKTTTPLIEEKVKELIEENKAKAIELKSLKKTAIKTLAKELIAGSSTLGEICYIGKLVALEIDELPLLAESLSEIKTPYLFVLAAKESDVKCQVLIKVSKDLQAKGLQAGTLIKELAPLIEGSGGGKADSAQAGGKNPKGLEQLFSIAQNKLEALC